MKDATSTKIDFLFLSTYIILIVGVILSGYVYIANYENEYKANVVRQLTDIAEMKTEDIARWRSERLNDGNIFYRNAEFTSLVKKYLSDGRRSRAEHGIKFLMNTVYQSHEYEAVFLLDNNYRNRLSIHEGREKYLPEISKQSIDSVRAGKPVYDDLHYNEPARGDYLNILVPIVDGSRGKELIGIIVLRVDPRKHLFPLFQRWPSHSKSGDSYLVRREGNEVSCFNLRRGADTQLIHQRINIALKKDQVAVQAVIHEGGIVEGLDGRGVDVVADVHQISQSPWYLVAKIDKSEIYASSRERQLKALFVVVLLVISASLIFGLAFRRNTLNILRLQLEASKIVQESQQNLSITLNSIGDGVISTDVHGNVTHLNPVAERLCGWTIRDAQGKSLAEVFDIVDAESREVVPSPVVRVIETGDICKLANHTVLRSKTGMEYQIADSAAPIRDDNKKILGAVLVFSDITDKYSTIMALRESESRYKMLADNTSDVIWVRDMTGGYVYVSPSIIQLRGSSPEEVMQQPFDREFFPGSQKIMMERMHHLLDCANNRRQCPNETVEVEQHCADGTGVWTEIVMRILYDDSDAAIGIIGVTRNIQDRKRSEEALQHAQRVESIGVLAGGIAHDFNNLLGVMLGNVELAQAHIPAPHPSLNYINNAVAAIDSASMLTKQLLAYSGKGKNQSSEINIIAMVREHLKLFEVSLSKKVKVIAQLPSRPVYVNGDPGQIEQIIMNLIINAGEAIGEKHGIVAITVDSISLSGEELAPYNSLLQTSLNDGEYALIEVRDDGIGMSRETLEKIFEPFYTTKFTGRGLGLSAVLGIIKAHRGGIVVESQEGIGTTFRTVIPTCPAPVDANEMPADRQSMAIASKKGILIIDDDVDIAYMAGDILESDRFTTFIEINPRRGVDLYREHEADIGLVLLDLTMPEMSGREVVQALRLINPDVKIIIQSGYSEDAMQKEMGIENVSGFIEKPYDIYSLLTLVRNVV